MTNKFVSFLEHVGHEFKRGLNPALRIAETAGEVAVSIFAPGLGPLFNSTVAAVITAEQNAAAIGQQHGSGAQKASSVFQLMGPLIKQTLADLGRPNDDAEAQKYIESVVRILNAVPADAFSQPVTASQPAPVLAAPVAPIAGTSAGTSASTSSSSMSPIQSVLP